MHFKRKRLGLDRYLIVRCQGGVQILIGASTTEQAICLEEIVVSVGATQ